MNYIIRKAKIEDLEQLYPLVEEFVSSFMVDRDSLKNSLLSLVGDSDALLLVVEKESELVGYCLGFLHLTFYANGKVAWLEEIMIKSDYHRHGIGKALMEKFEIWAKDSGALLSALATRRASSFYDALGYEESATYYRKIL